jgi:hypothetical protein
MIKQQVTQENRQALERDIRNRRVVKLQDEMRKCYFANAPHTDKCQELVDAYLLAVSERAVFQYDPETKTITYPDKKQ